MIGVVSAAQLYVDDPTDCPATDPTNFPGQDCTPDEICGDISDIAQCLDTSTITAPTSNATTNTLYDSSFAGYIIDCYRTTTCDFKFATRNSTCYTTRVRDTVALENTFGESVCDDCRIGYDNCTGDPDVCEVQLGVTACATGANNNVPSCGSCACDSGFQNCTTASPLIGCDEQTGVTAQDNPNTVYAAACGYACSSGYQACEGESASVEGCNYETGVTSCTTGGGKPGLIGSGCSCDELAQEQFITNELASGFGNNLVWGNQTNETGALVNLFTLTYDFIVNSTGAFFNGTELGAGGSGGVTPHVLNGTNHTGNLSSGRVVKDTGDSFIDELLDSIIDQLKSFIDIGAVNITQVNASLNSEISLREGNDSAHDSSIADLETNASQINGTVQTHVDNLSIHFTEDDIFINASQVDNLTVLTNETPIGLENDVISLVACPDTQVYAYNTTFGGWQCQSKASSGGTVTSVSGDDKYVKGTITSAGSFTFNESELNATIDDRQTGGAGKTGDDIYLYNDSDTMYLNETKLNDTISLTIQDSGIFVNYTSTVHNGSIINGSAVGYEAGSNICNSEIPGTHMCQMYEVVKRQNLGEYDNFTATFWVSEGAPGFTANANDCVGWKGDTATFLGAIWVGNDADGGNGALTACNNERALACCK